MDGLSRRGLLSGAAGLMAAAATAPAPALGQARRFLGSDIGQLGSVLVHSLSSEDLSHDRLGRDLLPDADSDLAAARSSIRP
jgi:hypothetical protein